MHWLAYTISRVLVKLIFALLGKIYVLRGENSAMRGPYILAANHISHFDPPLITTATRRKIDWMATAELFEHPVSRFYFWAVDTFRTDRLSVDRAAVRSTLERLKRGRVVGIFPERGIRAGERSVLGGAPMNSGIATLADMAGVPILPCVILGTDRLYHKKQAASARVEILGRLRRADRVPGGHAQEGGEGCRRAGTDRVDARLVRGVAREVFHLAGGCAANTPAAHGEGVRIFSKSRSLRASTLRCAGR